MSDENLLWTPDGVVDLDAQGKPRDKIELRSELGEWFLQADLFFHNQQVRLVCGKCGEDIVGRNAMTDRVMTVVCKCREWVFTNRDWRAGGIPNQTMH